MSRPQLPPIRLFKPKMLACVYLDRRRVYLGPHGSSESLVRYHEVVSRWLLDRPEPPPVLPTRFSHQRPRPRPDTVAQLTQLYSEYAQEYYLKRGRPTAQGTNIARAIQLLGESGLIDTDIERATPLWLKDFQRWLAADEHRRWARVTINEYVRIIQRMFQWALSEMLVPVDLCTALASVRSLRKGRAAGPGIAPPREGKRVQSVPRLWLVRSRPHMPRPVRLMVNLQLLTGARPSEICALRVRDIIVTSNPRVWEGLVSPDIDKGSHHEDRPERRLYFGPRAQRILRPLLVGRASTPDLSLFSPRRFMAEVNAARRAARKSKRWPSHETIARRARRDAGPDIRGDFYSVSSYRRAITRACDAAGVPRWHPHQLRHNRATDIASTESLHVAQELLGHADISTTMRYVDRARRGAIDVAARRA